MSISYAVMLQGFQVEPSLTVTELYDDNVNLSSSPRNHDFITALTPMITLSHQGLKADVSFSYQANAQFYRERSELNTVKHIANINTGYKLSQTVDLKLQDGFIYSPDATDIAATGIITTRTKQYNNSVLAGLSQKLSPRTSAAVEYNYVIQRYENPLFFNSTVHGVQLAMTHGFTPIDTIKFGVGFRYFDFVNINIQRVYTVSIGDTHRFSETFSLDVSGGANLYRDPNNHYTPSAFYAAALRKSWQHVSANLSYQRDLAASGGIATSVQVNESVVLGIQAALTEKLSTNLSGIYATNKLLSGSSIDLVSYSGTAGLDYEVLAWLKGQIRYTYFQQNSHGTVGNDFRRNQAFVGLTATLPK